MAENGAREAKLVQYLVEAYGKERELETSLGAHIGMTDRKPYKKRLQEHLKETRNHARLVERRAKKLGAGGTVATALKEATALTGRATALAKGPLHMARGTGSEEKLLKNAKTEYSEEHEEIAMYRAIEVLAEEVGDKETAKMARQIRRDEERMANFLERQIPVLTKAVVKAEIPASERNGGRRRSSRKRSSSGSRSSSKKRASSTRSRSSSSKGRSSSSSRGRSSSSSKRRSSSSSRGRSSSSSRSRSSSSGRGRSSGRRRSGSRS
jgi:ferritin-like metal-binding protein YciE